MSDYTYNFVGNAKDRSGRMYVAGVTRVKHRGTKMLGTVQRIVPQLDGSLELEVQRDEPLFAGRPNPPTWWASYHVDPVNEGES